MTGSDLPRGAIGPGATRVLLTLMGQPCPTTWRVLAEATGLAKGTIDGHLKALRREGLVTWEPGRRATLRPTVRALGLVQRAAS